MLLKERFTMNSSSASTVTIAWIVARIIYLLRGLVYFLVTSLTPSWFWRFRFWDIWTSNFRTEKNSNKKCAQAMSVEKKNFKQLKKALPPIRWQDENLCHDREDASDMMQYLKRICVEFEQTWEKFQSHFFFAKKKWLNKMQIQRLLSTCRKNTRVIPLNGQKKGRHEELTRSNLFCPHFFRVWSVMSFVQNWAVQKSRLFWRFWSKMNIFHVKNIAFFEKMQEKEQFVQNWAVQKK